MKVDQFKSVEAKKLVEAHYKKNTALLESVTRDLTAEQRTVVENIVNEFKPLIEYTLTPDQITNIFGAAEKQATASGNNRTGLGKAADVAGTAAKLPVEALKAVDGIVNKVGSWLQDTTPVKNFDAQFEQLKTRIQANNPDSKVIAGVKQMGEWAKQNPGKTAAIIGVLTAVASLAGGPLGGAIAGQVLRGSAELMKGSKLSTAIGKGIKTGVYSYLAGLVLNNITDNMLDNIATAGNDDLDALQAQLQSAANQEQIAAIAAEHGIDPSVFDDIEYINMSGNINAFNYHYNMAMSHEDFTRLKALQDAYFDKEAFTPEYYAGAAKFHDAMIELQNSPETRRLTGFYNAVTSADPAFLSDEALQQIIDKADSIDDLYNNVDNLGKGAQAVVQGAIAAAGKRAEKAVSAEPVDPEVKAELEKDKQSNAPKESLEQRLANRLAEGWGADEITPYQNGYTIWHRKQSRPQNEPAYWVYETPPDADIESKLEFDRVIKSMEPIAKVNDFKSAMAAMDNVTEDLKSIAAAAKNAAASAMQTAKNVVSTKVGNVTNKVTADKLLQAWRAAGKPTDSEQIAQLLKSNGIEIADAQAAFAATGLEKPTGQAPAADNSKEIDQYAAMINKLPDNEKAEIIKLAQAAGAKA